MSRKFNRLALKQKIDNDNYPTPRSIYEELDREFHFNHDPCPINPQGLREVDGLSIPDHCEKLVEFVNPPYSEKVKWITRSIEIRKRGGTVVMLLPVAVSTSYFHDLIVPNLVDPTIGKDIRFVRKRIQFRTMGHPAFDSMICVFRPKP